MAFDASKYVQYLEDWQVLICLHEKLQILLDIKWNRTSFSTTSSLIFMICIRRQANRTIRDDINLMSTIGYRDTDEYAIIHSWTQNLEWMAM